MLRAKTSRWRYGLLSIVFSVVLVGGIVSNTLPAAAANLGTCQFTDKNTITNCSFLGNITFTNGGSGTTFGNTPDITCHAPGLIGSTIYTIKVGSKITGG